MVTLSSFVPGRWSNMSNFTFLHRNATAVYMDSCHMLMYQAVIGRTQGDQTELLHVHIDTSQQCTLLKRVIPQGTHLCLSHTNVNLQ
jgi:hypothetical protein